MGLSLDFLSLVLGDVAILSIGAFAWKRNNATGPARSFFVATVAFTIWLTTNYLSVQPFNATQLDVLTRLSYVAGVWLMLTAWYFCYRFPIQRKPTALVWSIIGAIFILGSIFSYSNLVVASVGYGGGRLLVSAGTGYVMYGVLLAALGIAALGSLWRNYGESDLLRRNQIRYVGFGIGVSTAISITLNVVMVPLFGASWGSALANLFVTVPLVIFLGYALIRHRYTEIHRLLSWISAYVFCFAIVASWLLLVELALPELYPESVTGQRVGVLASATIAIFAFQPIARVIKRHSDRLFSVGWYDSQAFLNTMGSMLAGELHLAPLLKNSLHFICTELQVTSGELVIITENGEHKKEVFGGPHKLIGGVDTSMLPKSHHIIIADELPGNSPLLADFEAHDVRIGVPLETRGRRVGYLFLGIKQRGDIFAPRDISVLEILSSQLAVAIVSAQAYEKINSFNETLQEEIAEATMSLRQANEKLQVEDRMKTEFIILTSHNLRTPLSIVKGYMSLLEDTKIDKNQAALLASMKAGADRLSQFTEDLLAIDSIVAGRQLILKPTKLIEILEPLIKEAQDSAHNQALVFSVDTAAVQDSIIDANVLRLTGAIRNIFDNAFKFTKEGSVTLTATVDNTEVALVITDTGIGIAKEEMPHLLDRFHRATSAMHYDYEGEGIGLYLTDLVIKEHGGSLVAESVLGEGSTFTIRLPIKR